MAVSTKRRRKITVSERRFLWYVKDNEGIHHPWSEWLVVYAEDKTLYITFGLKQDQSYEVGYRPQNGEPQTIVYPPREKAQMRVQGVGFVWPLNSVLRNGWVECPVWDKNGIVTPSDVRRLIEWCLSK